MEVFRCPECGTIVEASIKRCPNCEYPFKRDEGGSAKSDVAVTKTEGTRSSSEQDGKPPKKKHAISRWFSGILVVAMIAFFVLAGQNFSYASYVKNEYYSSDYYSVNAYVGGDAYNYIINGTYFTGYCVKGVGFLISGVLCGVGTAVIMTNKGEK